MNNTKLFMLDNLDSFTYNLVDEFCVLGFEPTIYRNTLSADFIIQQMLQAQQSGQKILLVLSPGPGTPKAAGCLMELIAKSVGKFPILGICLGHQALIEHFGGVVDRAPEIVHGKSSLIEHCGTGAFSGFTNPMSVARYHSLVATSMPDELAVIAKYQSLPMAIGSEKHQILGFQFHPESLLTCNGSELLSQSIQFLLAQNNKDFNHGQ